mgnify:CR=1 FL=1
MKQKLLKSIKLAPRSAVQIFIMLRSSTLACGMCVGAVGGGSVLLMNTEFQDLNNGIFNLQRVELGGGTG